MLHWPQILTRESEAPKRTARRLRLEIDLVATRLPMAAPRRDIQWERWAPPLCDTHAALIYEGFRGEDDAELLPTLGTLEGCADLMRQIVTNARLIPEATWIAHDATAQGCPCAAVQVIGLDGGVARIMNLVVLPEWRALGIGRALLVRSLRHCRLAGFSRVQLDVTESNNPAMNLYRSLGFRRRRAFYCNRAR